VEFSKTVNIAPDTSALRFFYNKPDIFENIVFGDQTGDSSKNELLRKMSVISNGRKRIMKSTIESVKFQISEYNRTGKAPKF
jgi:hypothetical protein